MVRLFRDRAWGRVVRLMVVGGLAAVVPVSGAQTVPEKNAPDGTYTLHVYTDLLQVPTIVMTRLHSNYRSLTKESFTLSLDSGPRFHPVNVRLEGDDPITLAVVLDLTTDDPGIFTSFAHAMSTLPPGVLSARDYVSVYAYDCKLVRTTEDKPATPEQLQAGMVKVLTEGKQDSRDGAKQSCASGKRLYDVIARVGQDIGEFPGRRVILVISDGVDRHSVNDWLAVSRFAGSKSIAVFGLRPVHSGPTFGRGPMGTGFNDGWFTVEEEDPFGKICASTGGVVLDGDSAKKFMAGQIQRMITMLRNRYIIEFPRPANGEPGHYSIDVQIKDPGAVIRPAGVAFPPRDRDAKTADGTIPQDESKMPVVGTKKQDQPK